MKLNDRFAELGLVEREIPQIQLGLNGGLDDWLEQALARELTMGTWHEFTIDCPLQVASMLSDFADCVMGTRSYDDRESNPERVEREYYNYAVLKLDPRCLIEVGRSRVTVFARDRGHARDVAEGLWVLYHRRPKPRPAAYQLIKTTTEGIQTQGIQIKDEGKLSGKQLQLHYGSEFIGWHDTLVSAFETRDTGITLLNGPPGTGKTSYLRGLVNQLKDSHRFYFVPSSDLGVLKNSAFVDFWACQRRWYPEKQMVVILEDAEEALLPRSSDNQAEVTVLLNITDGLLGEFLKLQVICTVNCPLDHLDPALLRPGRLVARHTFKRLLRVDAQKVADSIGKSLPEGGNEFSLAEIFAGERDSTEKTKPRLGFQV
ncbi:MAG: AAA family ATPase [Verrucomicrobiota bacterium]